MQNEVINNLKENVKRLEAIIKQGFWNKGYIQNCKDQINSYKLQIVRLEHKNVTRSANGREAVIVENSQFKTLGVQFWTPEMIQVGQSVNTDRSISNFVAPLYI